MNDDTSLLVSALQNGYHFRELNIIRENPFFIGTERGIKRIRFWNDERLLRTHMDWRRLLLCDHFFVDRMYATVSGSPFIRYGRFAITCHDAPLDEAGLSAHEEVWAEAIASLIRKSRGAVAGREKISVLARAEAFYDQAERSGAFYGRAGELARLCYPEVRERAYQCDSLRSRHTKSGKSFILPADFSFRQCRALLDTLFIELGQSGATSGYSRLADFFLESDRNEGEDCLRLLFLRMKEKGVPDEETADLVQAAWYEPEEWFRLTESMFRIEASGEQDTDGFKKIWDQKTRIIGLFQSVYAESG